MKKFLKKHKKLCIVLVIVLIVVGLITSCVKSITDATQAAMEMLTKPNLVELERRTLVSSVSATGKVTSNKSKSVVAGVSGVDVAAVYVKLGDYVKEGDVLCVLDSTDLSEDLADTKKALSDSQKKSNMDLASAQKKLEEAQENRKIHNARNEQSVINAWDDYEDQCDEIDELKKARDNAKAEVAAQQKKIDEKKDALETVSAGDAAYTQLETEIQEATSSRDANQAIVATKEAEIEAAQKVADSLFNAYVKAAEVRADGERSYDSNVDSMQTSLEASKLTASSTGKTEKEKIESFEEQIAECTVVAPFSGVITSVDVEEGDIYKGTSIVTLEDDSAYVIETQIDEYDIGKIEIGQRVVVKTNATGDEELDGTVIQIAPRATASTTGGVTYTVKISLNTNHEMIRLDMTAKLSIILSEKKNVLTVPYDAVSMDDDGKYYIEVVDENAPVADAQETEAPEVTPMPMDADLSDIKMPVEGNYKKIYVERGIESDYYIEVSSPELEVGMQVLVPQSMEEALNLDDLMIEFGPAGGM